MVDAGKAGFRDVFDESRIKCTGQKVLVILVGCWWMRGARRTCWSNLIGIAQESCITRAPSSQLETTQPNRNACPQCHVMLLAARKKRHVRVVIKSSALLVFAG